LKRDLDALRKRESAMTDVGSCRSKVSPSPHSENSLIFSKSIPRQIIHLHSQPLRSSLAAVFAYTNLTGPESSIRLIAPSPRCLSPCPNQGHMQTYPGNQREAGLQLVVHTPFS